MPTIEALAKVFTAILIPAIEIFSAILEPIIGFIGEMYKTLATLLIPILEKVAGIISPISDILGKIFGKKTEIVMTDEQAAAKKRYEEIKQQLKTETDPERAAALKYEGKMIANAINSALRDDDIPMSSNTGLIRSITESRHYEEQRSRVDMFFHDTPAGTAIKQTGKAPPIGLNLGFSGPGF